MGIGMGIGIGIGIGIKERLPDRKSARNRSLVRVCAATFLASSSYIVAAGLP